MSEKRLSHDSSLDIRLGKCEKDNLNNLWSSNGTGLVHYIDVRTRAVRIFRLMSDEKVKLIGDERCLLYTSILCLCCFVFMED